nr:LysR substrate-binding domain-containing protein [Azospirillum thermophilum]
MREEGSGTRAVFDAAMRRIGLGPSGLPIAMTLPSGSVIRDALLAGVGPSVLSDLVVAADLQAGRIVALDGLDLPNRTFQLVRHRDRHRSAAEREFVKLALGS